MEVAFLGLGQMGTGMVGRLLEAGHRVTVWNRDGAKSAPFAARGAQVAASPAAAARAGTAMTMLANDAAVEAVVFGAAGLLAAGPGLLHVSCSTVGTALTERLTAAHAAAGQRFVSAQVLGRPEVAAAGRLSVIAAGPPADLDAAQPLFEAIGAGTTRMGERPVMATAAKIALNAGIPAIIQMLSEQLRIAGAHGVPPARLLELLRAADYGNRMIGSYGPLIAEQRFEPAGFPMRLGRKDVGLALAAVEGAAVEGAAADAAGLPLVAWIAARMDAIIAAGGGERDWSALGQPPAAG
ncbi:NAD(P)-dependent oxidoreductase [Roseicella frigidaeris]|uniref:NAD(P)-dependent oxidoreductase n=1 Tax=Roseicella frigidaeris TaxID=2230885 RepID=A0A327MCF0_9PROT|nr:NAD(P)-dependent oxidoreductase [Roseicella frigidaeris]RAI59952.1 NAD(P)-dependent oxidoreductase [Roseicella frigidaeris]